MGTVLLDGNGVGFACGLGFNMDVTNEVVRSGG